MFALNQSVVPVGAEVRDLFARTWRQIAAPGTWWNGPERIAIAQMARKQRRGEATRDPLLSEAGNDAVALLATRPAATTQGWVDTTVAALSLGRYVELVGIVSNVVAVDTVTRLVGCELEPFPEPLPGAPSGEPVPAGVGKRSAWIAMESPPVPPNVLAAVPEAQRAMIDVTEALYMTGPEMADPDITISGLHRTQIELVATTTSHGNECFY